MMDLENLKAKFWDGTYVDESENGQKDGGPGKTEIGILEWAI